MSVDYTEAVGSLREEMTRRIHESLADFKSVWFMLSVEVTFKKILETEKRIETSDTWFVISKTVNVVSGDVHDSVESTLTETKRRIVEHEGRGSSWVFESIKQAHLLVCKYSPMSGSSYLPTPEALHKKQAVVNVMNRDQKCLVWALLSAKYRGPYHDPQRVSNYVPYEKEIYVEGIKLPVVLDKSIFKRSGTKTR
jgi:hypothetical protein